MGLHGLAAAQASVASSGGNQLHQRGLSLLHARLLGCLQHRNESSGKRVRCHAWLTAMHASCKATQWPDSQRLWQRHENQQHTTASLHSKARTDLQAGLRGTSINRTQGSTHLCQLAFECQERVLGRGLPSQGRQGRLVLAPLLKVDGPYATAQEQEGTRRR